MSHAYIDGCNYPAIVALLCFCACSNPEEPEPPPPPATSTPATISVQRTGSLAVRVSWTDSVAGRGGFIISRAMKDSSLSPIRTVSESVRSILDTVRWPGIYRYAVAALEGGQSSTPIQSDWISLLGLSSAMVSRRFPAQIGIEWRASSTPETMFRIDRKLDDGGYAVFKTVGRYTNWVVDTMVGYYTYRYRITALVGNDTTESIETDTITYNSPFVSDFVASYYDQEYLRLSWTDQNPIETGFVIELSVAGSPPVVVSAVERNSISIMDTAAAFGNHEYTIRAVAGVTSSAKLSAPILPVTHWLPAFSGTQSPTHANLSVLPGGDVLAFSTTQTQVYSYNSRRWESAGKMAATSLPGFGIPLQDGKVLKVLGAIGEVTPGGVSEYINEIYDPLSRVWSRTGSFQTPIKEPADCRLTLLPDGEVFAAGWYSTQGYLFDSICTFSEIYSPVSGTFRSVAPFPAQRGGFALAALSGGKILAAGGAFPVRTSGSEPSTECYVFDPVTNAWAPTASMPIGGFYLNATAGLGSERLLVHGDVSLTYQTQAGIWTHLTTMPRIVAACPLDGDAIYVLAGSLMRLSLSTGTWNEVEPFPLHRLAEPSLLRILPNGRLLATDGTAVEVYIEHF